MEIKQHSLKCQMDQKGESQGILESILKWKQTNKKKGDGTLFFSKQHWGKWGEGW
jgi:hypothetical protein